MTSNKAADRLAWLSTSVLLVAVGWGNGWAILAVSLASIAASAALFLSARNSLSRSAAWTLAASILTSAGNALVAWKGKL
jgi:hypothetical protein